MQARVAEQLRDPVMKGLAYCVAGYTGASFIYSLTNKEHVKAAPKKAPEAHAPAAASKDHHAPASAPVASVAVEHAAPAAESSPKQQVAPVLQQLTQISDRLTKIEKALGI